MGKLQQATRASVALLLVATLFAWIVISPGPAAAQGQEAWEGPIVRQPAAEARLVAVMNALRTSVYDLPALTPRPFEGADIDYITCLVNHNRGIEDLEHYPATCGRTVQNGGAEVLAWNWSSLGGTTNDLVNAWNNSTGHRNLMLGTGDQVSAGVFCVGATAYGVAWFRRADNAPAQGTALAKKEPAGPTFPDLFRRDRLPFYDDDTYVCQSDGSAENRYRPHSTQESTLTPTTTPTTTPATPTPDPTTPTTAPAPSTVDAVIEARPVFTVDHADVLRLYRAFFSRQPDAEGAKYWLDVLDGGENPSEIAGHMSATTEFQNTFGTSSNRDFLLAVYRNALGREPDADGFNYWLGLIDSGQLSRTDTVFYVAFGTELRTAHPFGGK